MTKIDLFTEPAYFDGLADEAFAMIGEEEYKRWIQHPATRAMLLRFKAEAVRSTICVLEGQCPKDEIDFYRGKILAMSMMVSAITQEEFN